MVTGDRITVEKSGPLPNGFLSRYRHGDLVGLIGFLECAADYAAEGKVCSEKKAELWLYWPWSRMSCLLFTKADFESGVWSLGGFESPIRPCYIPSQNECAD